jgi:UDPglucose 6-dehydrogenase
MSKLKIGFAGMTHLGTCSSIGASIFGNDVIAFDLDNEIILKRKSGIFDKAEPEINEFLSRAPSNFKLTMDIADLKICDFVVISVDSPVDDIGNVDTGPVEKLFDLVNLNIDSKIPIVILSQVRPGFTRAISKNRKNTYYQMETLIFGQGLERALNPERYVIGLQEESQPIDKKYEEFLKQGQCPILKMSLESAELTKLSANFFLASTITSTNTLSALCSKLGGNWGQIAESLRLDRRIGPYAYLNPGLGIGGSNIIRDLLGIREMSNIVGTESSIVDSILANSEFSKNWLIRQINELIQKENNPKIGILGLSYKQNTESTIGSSGVKTAEIFSKYFPVFVYDPAVKAHKSLNTTVNWSDSASDVISNVNILVFATDWSEFKTQKISDNILASNVIHIVDPLGCQTRQLSHNSQISYRALGSSPKNGEK